MMDLTHESYVTQYSESRSEFDDDMDALKVVGLYLGTALAVMVGFAIVAEAVIAMGGVF